MTALLDRVVRDCGHVDAPVNNAGVGAIALAEELGPALWSPTLAVNLTGTFLCAHAAARHMLNADRGDARPRALESRHRSSMTLATARSISASRAAWPSGRGTNGSNTT